MVDDTLSIPRHLHNAVIGPKGRLLRSVMDECGGVKIRFPTGDDRGDEVRRGRGSPRGGETEGVK